MCISTEKHAECNKAAINPDHITTVVSNLVRLNGHKILLTTEIVRVIIRLLSCACIDNTLVQSTYDISCLYITTFSYPYPLVLCQRSVFAAVSLFCCYKYTCGSNPIKFVKQLGLFYHDMKRTSAALGEIFQKLMHWKCYECIAGIIAFFNNKGMHARTSKSFVLVETNTIPIQFLYRITSINHEAFTCKFKHKSH